MGLKANGISSNYESAQNVSRDWGATTYYLHSTVLGGQVVAELEANGTWRRGYVYAGGQLVALQQYGEVNWAHQDPVNKSQRITNAAGTVIAGIELDPWGGATGRSWNNYRQPREYTTYDRGQTGDESLFRRYHGWFSRFAHPDPYDGSYNMSDPQSLNRYAYVQNDPVNFVDPSGLDSCHVDLATGQIVCIPDITGSVDISDPWAGLGVAGGGGGGRYSPLQDGPSEGPGGPDPQDPGPTPSPAVGGLIARVLASLAARLLARKAVTAAAGIVFGHGARHLAGTGLSQRAVEAAIRTNLQQGLANATSVSGNFWGRVAVNGTTIEYRAFTLANGTINVGTYYPIP